MSSFLSDILDNTNAQRPGKIMIDIPVYNINAQREEDKRGHALLAGLMVSEPTFVTQNKWGPIVGETANLTDTASLLGASSIPTWIHASTLCWKGTDPIRFNVDFYLINYSRDVEINNMEGLKNLASLTSLTVNSDITAIPHGGYAPDLFLPNTGDGEFWSGLDSAMAEKDLGNIGALTGNYYNAAHMKNNGTASVYIGTTKYIPNVLVSRLDTTPSLVEVESGNPLYIKVSVSFTGISPLTRDESDIIYNYQFPELG